MSTENQAQENKMGVMPENRLLLTMAIPIVISMLVQALYNVVDSVFVAQLSEDALNAVSLAFPVQNLMIAVAVGTGVGINALLSKSLGEGNQAKADRTAMNGLFLSALSFLVFAVIGLPCSRLYFTIQTDIQRIVDYGESYMMICCVCSFGVFFQITLERTLQATGRTLYTMFTQATGAIINIILDPIMIFGLLGCPAMGITGAAVATVVGQVVSMTVGFVANQTKNKELKLSAKEFKVNGQSVREILSVGFPSVIMQAINSLLTVFMNMILIGYGSVAVSVLGVYFKLQSFVFMPVFGLGNGMVAIIGYNYGARLRNRIYDGVKVSLTYAAVIMAIGTILFWAFPEFLMGLFETSGEAASELTTIGVPALRTISLSFIMAAVGITLSNVFQAIGKGTYSLLMSLMRQLIVLLPAAWLLSNLGGLSAIWWSFPIAEVVSLCLCLHLYRKVDRTMLKPLGE